MHGFRPIPAKKHLKEKNSQLAGEIEELKERSDGSRLENENLIKKLAERDRTIKELHSENENMTNKLNQMSETKKDFDFKQKEWNEVREVLAANIKTLKNREKELQRELELKNAFEREEIEKRHKNLNKKFFKDDIKPVVISDIGTFTLM